MNAQERETPPSVSPAPARIDYPPIDAADYDRRLRVLAQISTSTAAAPAPVRVSSATPKTSAAKPKWPADAPCPDGGAILPFKRIVAYYGNFMSKKMGILGELPENEMLEKLASEVAKWNAADPDTPVMPAIHYVAVTAQREPGADKKYRLRMPGSHFDRAKDLAVKAGGVVFMDVQVGHSTVQSEVKALEAYLKQPDVHLGLDPEFAMKGAVVPGTRIGAMDAAEINWTIAYLSKLVQENGLPPKVLVIHRFVPSMLTSMKRIRPTPQVQVVIDMDGWGAPEHKIVAYRRCVTNSPVQFSGLKIFYKNDLRPKDSRLMKRKEILSLTPQPIYIQYQ